MTPTTPPPTTPPPTPGRTGDGRPEILATPTAARTWTRSQRLAGHRIALVPTMGALHAGHLELVRVAHDHADAVVVSVFVNPLQFDRADDLEAYPRTLDDDLAACSTVGVDAVYAPTAATMYPHGFDTSVQPGQVAEPLEGLHRPGHFQGVATVVTKLFAAVEPDVAVFGRKDAQQLAVVRQLTRDLDLGVEVIGVPTVREADGVAMSSRNRRLSPDARRAARHLSTTLAAVRSAVAAGASRIDDLRALMHHRLVAPAGPTEPPVRVEYADIVDGRTFVTVDSIDDDTIAVLAAWVGDVRLIDNAPLLGHDDLDTLGQH